MISIGIYDEHKLALEGANQLFKTVSEINVILMCVDKSLLKTSMKSTPIHVLLLTMHDISISTINLIVQLNIQYPKTKILIISTIQSEEIILKNIKAAAKGFLGKD